MSYIQITGRTYINPRHIVSISIDEQTETRIRGEYTEKAKFHYFLYYHLNIKMSNGDSYKETFKNRKEAEERRDNLTAHW